MSTIPEQLNEQAIALPNTISQSGSCVLTGNLIGSKGLEGTVSDADDVAPAVIQSLHEVGREKQAETVGLETRNSDLEACWVALEQIVGMSIHNPEEGDKR